jgi:2-desacetyl-2-hydroxyethyl bacteriochlorophyllide A dehydrogenase
MDCIQLVFLEPYKTGLERCSIKIERKSQCLVRHEYTLISPGTEGALFSGTHIGFSDPDIPWARYPLKPGYAAAGVVAESSEDCALRPGDRVLYYGPHASHGILDTESMIWARLPAGDCRPFLLARFAQIAYSAVAALRHPPRNAVVFGAGIVGNLCAQLLAKLPGTEGVGILDLSERRLEIARECGVRGARSPGDLPGSPDTVVEATGAPSVVNEALARVGIRGQVLLLGSSRGTVEINVYKMVHRKLVSLIGAHESVLPLKGPGPDGLGPWVRWTTQQETADAMIGMIRDGSLTVGPFIQTEIRPDGIQDALRNLLERPNEFLGVFVRWD